MNLSRRTLGLTLLLSTGLMPPAFAAKVKTVLAKNTDMARYKTYQWLPPRILVKTGIDENNPNNPILKAAVNQELAQVGLKEVEEGADLMIQAYVLTASVPQLEAVLFGEGYNFDYWDGSCVDGPLQPRGHVVHQPDRPADEEIGVGRDVYR